MEQKFSVIPPSQGGGPHGLGDPCDRSLRRVEVEVMIPKKMRDIAKAEKCVEEVRQFKQCCGANSVFMVFTCRKENAELKECLTKWYNDEGFKERCKKEYLEERSLYRTTGVPAKKFSRIPASM